MKKIKINGTIIPNEYKELYEWFGEDSTAPLDIDSAISEAKGDALEVTINSGGGYITAGSEIYTALRNYEGDVNIRVIWAGSAASVIAMARHSVAEPTGMIMIHNVSGMAQGDYRDLQHEAEVMETATKALSVAYQIKTGMSEEQIRELMDKETWMTAREAVQLGFIDELAEANQRMIAGVGGVLSEKQLKQARKEIEVAKAKERFNKLKR